MFNKPWFAILALIASGQPLRLSSQLQFGSVEGEVVDARGTPIPGAKVYDAPMDAVRTGKDHFVVTDDSGRFLLRDVPTGKTMIIATKTEAGYPDARFAVYSGDEVLPVVQVQADRTTAGVVVKLLAKGGELRGRIFNSRSKLPISRSRIRLSRVDHPEWFIETDGETDGTFDLIIPSRPMHFEVSAQGFQTWTYERSRFSKNLRPLRVQPGEKTDIDVDLEPKQ